MNFDSEIKLLEAMRERLKTVGHYPDWHFIIIDINSLISNLMRLKELAEQEEAEREKGYREEQEYVRTAGHHI